MVKVGIISVFLFFLASCDKDCTFEISSDQLKFADVIEKNNNTYYLYTLTTGWNDKAVYFQLYKQKPILDQCKQSDVTPVYEIVHDDYPEIKYVKEIILQPDKPEKLKILYTTDKNEGIASVYDVKFTR